MLFKQQHDSGYGSLNWADSDFQIKSNELVVKAHLFLNYFNRFISPTINSHIGYCSRKGLVYVCKRLWANTWQNCSLFMALLKMFGLIITIETFTEKNLLVNGTALIFSKSIPSYFYFGILIRAVKLSIVWVLRLLRTKNLISIISVPLQISEKPWCHRIEWTSFSMNPGIDLNG